MPEGRNLSLRQGHFLSAQCISSPDVEDQDVACWVVASHDCDIAAVVAKEPYIEVFPCKLVKKLDTNAFGKNARLLRIDALLDDNPVVLEIAAVHKLAIPKQGLSPDNYCKSFKLTDENLTVFQGWLAARYRRSSYAEKFEELIRTDKLNEKLAACSDQYPAAVRSLLFKGVSVFGD